MTTTSGTKSTGRRDPAEFHAEAVTIYRLNADRIDQLIIDAPAHVREYFLRIGLKTMFYTTTWEYTPPSGEDDWRLRMWMADRIRERDDQDGSARRAKYQAATVAPK